MPRFLAVEYRCGADAGILLADGLVFCVDAEILKVIGRAGADANFGGGI